MKPFFKYSGGKQKEIKNIKNFFPPETKRIVEPFCGSCAVAFHFELPALVSDLDDDVINILSCVKNTKLFKKLMSKIENINLTDKRTERNNAHLEKIYYFCRDELWGDPDTLKKAYRYLILRQLCFSGMTRVAKSTGKSNVPYGWYGLFRTSLSEDHNKLLQSWEILKQDFELTLDEVKEGDWVFLDPPYFERNSTYEVKSDAGKSEELHIRLANRLKEIDEKWLLIHSDCDLYRSLYKGYEIFENSHRYAQNFKGRAIKKSKVTHLYITNY